VRVTATVANTPQLEWWLLGFGDAVEVVRPAVLRNRIKEMVSKLALIYRIE
jgi:predicted DNA-binding transcriptional regulator YafY